MNLHRSFLLLPLAVVFFACSGGESPAPVAQTSAPIIHGTESDSSQNAVVLIGFGAGGGWYDACSGVLIAPNLVLTARHCISNTSSGDGCASITGDIDAKSLRIYTGTTRSIDWISVEPQAYGKKLFHDNGTTLCPHDIGLILLDRSLQGGSADLAPVRLDAPPAKGDTFTAVGWGVTDITDNPGVRMQRPNVPIVRVNLLEFDVGESICHGDSGGPALSTTTGAVLGVVARGGGGRGSPGTGAAGCVDPGTINTYTGLWGFKTMITQAFAESGYDPWLEGAPDPRKAKFGAPCYSDSTCISNLCIKDPKTTDAGTKSSAGWCTQACDDATPCPTGTGTTYDCTAYPGSISDASVSDAGAPPAKVCTKHVDAPVQPPSAPASSGGGCATSSSAPSGTVWSTVVAWGVLVLGLRLRARRA